MRRGFLIGVLLIAGCCSYPGEAYIEADRSTYEWARPKLEEWATNKGGEWPEAVKLKLDSVKARIERGEQAGKESTGD